MKLCNYAQNNSEIYLATVIFYNLDLSMDLFTEKELYIKKVNGDTVGTVLRLRTPYWKTFPSLMVVPLANEQSIFYPMDRHSGRAPYNDILEINLL